ncbi:hypothetical protein RvY_04345 [Ramazzottius varieornatus]|uniref:Uncharacterized protein n=1 Tax=Ramazzottius varieornatus TaxID=947166 RepID=A0A1D1UY60_RAMVA|nr:hypothetical protein RvY_04345 [Ramazzottius varieornatus]
MSKPWFYPDRKLDGWMVGLRSDGWEFHPVGRWMDGKPILSEFYPDRSCFTLRDIVSRMGFLTPIRVGDIGDRDQPEKNHEFKLIQEEKFA